MEAHGGMSSLAWREIGASHFEGEVQLGKMVEPVLRDGGAIFRMRHGEEARLEDERWRNQYVKSSCLCLGWW